MPDICQLQNGMSVFKCFVVHNNTEVVLFVACKNLDLSRTLPFKCKEVYYACFGACE